MENADKNKCQQKQMSTKTNADKNKCQQKQMPTKTNANKNKCHPMENAERDTDVE
jgi:hypothetical protein